MQDSDSILDNLARDLSALFRSKSVTQQGMAASTGVSQSTISKASRRKLKRLTADTETLRRYANILIQRDELPAAVYAAARGFMSAGGSEAELVQAIEFTAHLIRGRPPAPPSGSTTR